MKLVFSFLVIFLILLFAVDVDSAKVTASFQIENVLPILNIGLFSDVNLENGRSGFNTGETGWIRIQVDDGNGYQDIKNVEVRLVGINSGNEVTLNGYENYRNTSFVNGEDGTGVYSYQFTLDQEQDSYRFYVRVKDKVDEVTSTIEFSGLQSVDITGAVVAAPTRNDILEFFRNLFSRIANIF